MGHAVTVRNRTKVHAAGRLGPRFRTFGPKPTGERYAILLDGSNNAPVEPCEVTAMSTLPPAAGRREREHRRGNHHVMRLFHTEEYLVESVRALLAPALATGRGAVVIATAGHQQRIEAAVGRSGADLGAHLRRGQYRFWDADELLSRLVADGCADEHGFSELVGQPVARMADECGGLAVYCELEAMAWTAGDGTAALDMEHFWNDLLTRPGCERLCAYPAVAAGTAEMFEQLCDLHPTVVPSELITETADDSERSRRIAVLEHRAASATAVPDLAKRNDQVEHELGRLVRRDRARNEYVTMMSRDVKGSVATVSALVRYLRDHWSSLSETEVAELSALGVDMTEHVEQLLEDMMTVGALETGELPCDSGPVHMTPVVRRAVEAVKRSTERGVVVRIAPDLPAARADEGRQMQILGSLLANAAAFSPRKTPIGVVVSRRGDYLAVTVADKGHGISKEEARLLFRPFSRLPGERRHQRGSGLGLYLSKLLVEAQGGTISVRTDAHAGTTFSYTVPVWKAQAP